MKEKLLPALYLLVTALLLATCVREVDFSKPDSDTDTLVVDGSLTDGPGPHILRLMRPGDVKKLYFEPVTGAQVSLSDDQGNRYEYQEIFPAGDNPPFYQLEGVQGMPGRSYTLEIRLVDGETFRSRPEKMPEPVPIGEATVQGEWFVSTNSDGTIVREPYACVYAQATVPAQPNGRYLRWDAEAVFIFNEILKVYNPFGVQHQCFVPNRLSDQIVALADLNKYQPGTALKEKVGKRYIDFAFEHRMGITVYQRSISQEAYHYWQKIGQLIEPTGTILDAPPARVYGNVENLTHPGQPALGYFEVAAVDTTRIYIRNGELGDEFRLRVIPYCEYDWARWPPVNHPECDDCLRLVGSTLEKPWWWQ